MYNILVYGFTLTVCFVKSTVVFQFLLCITLFIILAIMNIFKTCALARFVNNYVYMPLNCSNRVESYSCKMAGNDKRLYKLLTTDSTEVQALSPPQTYIGSPASGTPTVGPNAIPIVFVRSSSVGSGAHSLEQPQMCNTINKKILFHLISTLNMSFHPDYDFTDAKSDEFSLEPNLSWTMSSVKSNLSAALGDSYATFEQQLWSAIEDEIQLKECEIYR